MGRREMGREMNWGDAENKRIKNCIRLRNEKQESTMKKKKKKRQNSKRKKSEKARIPRCP